MHANDFITKREKLCKARHREIITQAIFTMQMHLLFCEAQLSKGWDDDAEKSDEVYETWVDQLEAEIEALSK
jgi:cob(I)alamin adenosyltransferase